jgi:hypothetical protein
MKKLFTVTILSLICSGYLLAQPSQIPVPQELRYKFIEKSSWADETDNKVFLSANKITVLDNTGDKIQSYSFSLPTGVQVASFSYNTAVLYSKKGFKEKPDSQKFNYISLDMGALAASPNKGSGSVSIMFSYHTEFPGSDGKTHYGQISSAYKSIKELEDALKLLTSNVQ